MSSSGAAYVIVAAVMFFGVIAVVGLVVGAVIAFLLKLLFTLLVVGAVVGLAVLGYKVITGRASDREIR